MLGSEIIQNLRNNHSKIKRNIRNNEILNTLITLFDKRNLGNTQNAGDTESWLNRTIEKRYSGMCWPKRVTNHGNTRKKGEKESWEYLTQSKKGILEIQWTTETRYPGNTRP
jgi:hypothetical protein